MHYTAMYHGQLFFNTYTKGRPGLHIVDLGAQDVNGSLRLVAPKDSKYVGADFATGHGVDVVLTDAYNLPFADESFDICVTSSCFEHAELFWLSFNEALRVLRSDGLLYMNVPSNGSFHRYPVDCWRFYPDAGRALETWAKRSGFRPAMLECFTGKQRHALWNDYVAVYVKDETFIDRYPRRIIDTYTEFTNGMVFGSDTVRNMERIPEDRRKFHWPWTLSKRFYRKATRYDFL